MDGVLSGITMANSNNDDKGLDLAVKIAGAAAVYLIVVKPIISTFGTTPEQEAAINSVNYAGPGESPFRADYKPTIDSFNEFYNNGDTGGMNLAQFIQYQKNEYDGLDEVPPLTWQDWTSPFTAADMIRDAFGFFRVHIFGNNSDVLTVFNTVPTKNGVSSLAAVMQVLYGEDLWTLLKEGGSTMWRGLSPGDLKYVVDRVNSLPDF